MRALPHDQGCQRNLIYPLYAVPPKPVTVINGDSNQWGQRKLMFFLLGGATVLAFLLISLVPKMPLWGAYVFSALSPVLTLIVADWLNTGVLDPFFRIAGFVGILFCVGAIVAFDVVFNVLIRRTRKFEEVLVAGLLGAVVSVSPAFVLMIV